MGHYDEYYEEQDRINAADKNNQIREEASKVRKEITISLPKNIDFKGYHPELVEKLAACRVHRFREDELNDLLTQIVKNLHRL